MNKTPVSILQELMVKKGTVPNYELIHDGGGSHVNTFTYQVTCDGLRATGTGRCKKDAKHEAAKAMLEKIAAHRAYPQLPASPAESPVRTPLPPKMPVSPRIPPDAPFVNAIGALQDLCAENNLQEPEYIPISEVGPPHAKVFTYHCIISRFKEEGVATTKKQAKQEAARKMLDRMKDVIGDVNVSDDDISILNEKHEKQDLANKIAQDRYPQLTKVTLPKKINLGLMMSEYHTKLKNSYDKSVRTDVINKLVNLSSTEYDKSNESIDSLLSELDGLLSILKLNLNGMWLRLDENNKQMKSNKQKLAYTEEKNKDNSLEITDSNDKEISAEIENKDEQTSVELTKVKTKKNMYAFYVRIDSSPNISEIGLACTKTEAKFQAITNLINTLILFLQ